MLCSVQVKLGRFIAKHRIILSYRLGFMGLIGSLQHSCINPFLWPQALGLDEDQAGFEKDGSEIKLIKHNAQLALFFFANGSSEE